MIIVYYVKKRSAFIFLNAKNDPDAIARPQMFHPTNWVIEPHFRHLDLFGKIGPMILRSHRIVPKTNDKNHRLAFL